MVMRPIERGLSAMAVVLAMLSASPAFAQSEAENRATARALAEAAHDALEAKDYKKSEDLFRRADALFHAPTISIGLARSQAGEGKFVESCESYNRIIREGNTTTPVFAEALEDAKKEVASVEGRRSRAVIAVTGPGPDAPQVTLDDAPIKNEVLGVALFVNPGTHILKVTAKGFHPASQSFTVAEGATQNVSLAMEPAPEEAVVTPPPPPPGGGATPLPVLPPDTGTTTQPNHVPSYIAFGVGGAGLVLGVVTGALAIGKHSSLASECPGGTCTTSSSQSDLSSYHTMGALSTVGFIVGGVGVAAGAILWFVAPSASAQVTTGAVTPYIGPGSAGVVGRF
jgi:hypothetical protein